MGLQKPARAAPAIAGSGSLNSSLLGGLDNREIAKKFVSEQAAYPSAARRARLLPFKLAASDESLTAQGGLALLGEYLRTIGACGMIDRSWQRRVPAVTPAF